MKFLNKINLLMLIGLFSSTTLLINFSCGENNRNDNDSAPETNTSNPGNKPEPEVIFSDPKKTIIKSNEEISDEELQNIFKYGKYDENDFPEKDKENPKAYSNYNPCRIEYRDNLEGNFQISLIDNSQELKINFNRINTDSQADFKKDIATPLNGLLQKLKEKNLAVEDKIGTDSHLKIKVEEFIKNEFFKDEPMAKLLIFMKSLDDKSKLNSFAKTLHDILCKTNDYLEEYDKMTEVQELRMHKGEVDPPTNRKALDFNKENKEGEFDEKFLNAKFQKYKRIIIKNSPLWLSINVVTGESSLNVNENNSYINSEKIKFKENMIKLLKKSANFNDLNKDNNTGPYFEESKGVYFSNEFIKGLIKKQNNP